MSPQQSIAHFRIVSKLGEGGMGVVYRATDTKLNRDVAIKVPPDSFAADPDRLTRFTREAQVLASLNHPNIAAIYGVEDRALVMELVEGPTLAERIAAGAIQVEEALSVVHQLIDALEYAHERGIIHRDFKPANIKITPEGRVKVLDFGLAKALSADSAAGDPASSPTLTMRATMAGTIMGTAAYMSPEQARGQKVDKRADIWAFGVVYYEMLTGRSLFGASTVSDSLAAVLTREPEWDRIPVEVRLLLRRCLEKAPQRRLHDIADVRVLLEEAVQATPAGLSPARRIWLTPAAAVLLLATILLAFVYFRGQPAAPQPVRFLISPPEGGFTQWPPRVSPDGRRIAFTATTGDGRALIWVREMGAVEAHALAGTDDAQSPFWSPDSRFIAFGARGKLRKVDASGGPPQTLCDGSENLLGGAWGRNGVILFGSSWRANYGGIYQVSEGGGAASAVTEVNSQNETFHAYPSFLPDGRRFIYLRLGEAPGVYVGSLDVQPKQQSVKRIVETTFMPAYAPPADSRAGWLLFAHEGALIAQRFDADRLESVGEGIPLVDHILTYRTEGYFSASPNGVLLYRSRTDQARQSLAWFDRTGANLGRVGDLEDVPGGVSLSVSLSPDGTRVALIRVASEKRQWAIFLLDLARNMSMQLTSHSFFFLGAPLWSPDGSRIVFGRDRTRNLYEKSASGGGDETLLLESASVKLANSWSKDGRFLLYTELDPKTRADLWVLPLSGDRKPVPYLRTGAYECQGQFSPDGHWIAYVSDETGRNEVYVQPFPLTSGNSLKSKISIAGGTQPRWRRDGTELYYLAPDRKLMAVDISTSPQFRPLGAHALFTAPVILITTDTQRYDVAADGKRFLFNTDATEIAPSPITVMVNWTAGLNR